MATGARVPFPRAPWDVLIALVGALGVVVFLVFAAATAIPPVLADRDARVSDGAVPVAVGAAEIVVPQGWIVTGGGDRAGVRTPDGVLVVVATSAQGSATAALQELLDAELGAVPTATVGARRTETLASGLRVVHTDVGDDAVFVVVADGDRALLGIIARVDAEHERTDYRASLGQLLDGVRA